MLPFALSIFTGAFLLFQVQPLIGKFILPWFGGSPGVWTTCLLFFQTVLLGGYAYAHFSTSRLKPRVQATLHLGLLLLALLLLPITPSDTWKTQIAGEPTWHILLLLVATIGLPYFVLSATGPLMQQWFGATHPGVSPYRLYALSNIGSLLALLSYPVFFEVRFSRVEQAWLWSGGLGVFAVLCGYCALRVWRLAPAPAAPTTDDSPGPAIRTSREDRCFWVALPALASVLLLATTNKLCQEIAVVPFLWVLPLALYLLSFVICFDHARWYHRGIFAALLVVALATILVLTEAGTDAPMKLQVAGYAGALFVICMICHGELYRLRPPPQALTRYFLFISAGGALGGLLVAIVAPAVFVDYREFELGLVALALVFTVLCIRRRSRALALGAVAGALLALVAIPALRSTFDGSEGIGSEFGLLYRDQRWNVAVFAVMLACLVDFRRRRLVVGWRLLLAAPVVLLAGAFGGKVARNLSAPDTVPVINASRNFYGTLKILDHSADNPAEHYRLLMHGATTHGLQFTADDRATKPTTYYGPTSGVGLALRLLPDTPGRHLGVVGLGTGCLAAYGRPGDTVRFYEINPAVVALARNPFTYLARSPAKVDVVLGDARLEMEHELDRGEAQTFDLLALDAFSSDAIPVHLLTAEAVAVYLKHLKPDGVIAIHVSNRYLELEPVVESLAARFDLGVVCIEDDIQDDWWQYSTTWMLVSRNRAFLAHPDIVAVANKTPAARTVAPWTDEKADLYSIMK